MRTPLTILALAALVACGSGVAQQQPKPPVPAIALATANLAGQSVIVLPLTMVVGDPRVPGTTGATARAALLAWGDSLLADVLAERAPEVTWVLPAALRRTAARAPGLVPSPDQMGQSVLRAPDLKVVPDPLRSHVRQLLALTGGSRFALIPAALFLEPAPGDSLKVQLSAVLTDGRLGSIVWRTLAVGQGATADLAYRSALATLLPAIPGTP